LSILDPEGAGKACARYLESWQAVRPLLRGDDLLALGVPAGEPVGAMLRRLRNARLDGELADRDAKLDFVRAELRARNGGQDGETTQG
jgi:tRNA nucleotidyltransferase (CCA-adding enzyme)